MRRRRHYEKKYSTLYNKHLKTWLGDKTDDFKGAWLIGEYTTSYVMAIVALFNRVHTFGVKQGYYKRSARLRLIKGSDYEEGNKLIGFSFDEE